VYSRHIKSGRGLGDCYVKECPDRKRVALSILSADPKDLDINIRKIKHLCLEDLLFASQSGKSGPRLYMLVWIIRRQIQTDVQECEGVNSMIKKAGQRSPNMTLPLLWARVSLKKRILYSSRGQSSKWSVRREQAQSVLDYES
jgi:hypothetical protein